MKVKCKKTSDTHAEIKVVFEEDEMKMARDSAIKRLAKDVKVQGFRTGKAPADLAAQQIPAEQINHETVDVVIRTNIARVFERAGVEPVEQPNIQVEKIVIDEMMECKTEVDIMPEIKLGDYHDLKVKKPEVKIKKEDVEEVIQQIAGAYAEKKVAKKPAAEGDEVVIDFTGTKDGKEFEGGKAKDFKLVLGSKALIPGFEEGIVGHEVGDKFDLPLTFPKDYGNKDLAGQDTVFSILLKQVNEIIKPELNDEFAAKCGPFKNMDELRKDISKNLKKQEEQRVRNQYRDDLVKKLVKESKLAAPEVMIKDQYNFIKNDVTRNAQSRGLTFEKFVEMSGLKMDEWEKEAQETAEMRVKMMLVLREVAKLERIHVSGKEVSAKAASMAQMYKNDPEAAKQLKSQQVRLDIANRIVVDKTIDLIESAQPAKVAKTTKK